MALTPETGGVSSPSYPTTPNRETLRAALGPGMQFAGATERLLSQVARQS